VLRTTCLLGMRRVVASFKTVVICVSFIISAKCERSQHWRRLRDWSFCPSVCVCVCVRRRPTWRRYTLSRAPSSIIICPLAFQVGLTIALCDDCTRPRKCSSWTAPCRTFPPSVSRETSGNKSTRECGTPVPAGQTVDHWATHWTVGQTFSGSHWTRVMGHVSSLQVTHCLLYWSVQSKTHKTLAQPASDSLPFSYCTPQRGAVDPAQTQ